MSPEVRIACDLCGGRADEILSLVRMINKADRLYALKLTVEQAVQITLEGFGVDVSFVPAATCWHCMAELARQWADLIEEALAKGDPCRH